MSQDPRMIPREDGALSPYLDYGPYEESEEYGEDTVGDGLLRTRARTQSARIAEWEIDWGAYFKLFDKEHGGCPVQIGQWLVWEDGWRCDAFDIGGTELRPPEKPYQLCALKLDYYHERLRTVRSFHQALESRLHAIRSIDTLKSMPLQIRSVTWQPRQTEIGQTVYDPEIHRGDLDLRDGEKALEDLDQDITYCLEQIDKLVRESL